MRGNNSKMARTGLLRWRAPQTAIFGPEDGNLAKFGTILSFCKSEETLPFTVRLITSQRIRHEWLLNFCHSLT
jgi:hypothetical protein